MRRGVDFRAQKNGKLFRLDLCTQPWSGKTKGRMPAALTPNPPSRHLLKSTLAYCAAFTATAIVQSICVSPKSSLTPLA
jgi:hypothetical protein